MIHCHRGISRSVTLLIAYTLYKLNQTTPIPEDEIDKTINNVLKDIKNHRTIADPNEGFLQALKKYIQTINGYQTHVESVNKQIHVAIPYVPPNL